MLTHKKIKTILTFAFAAMALGLGSVNAAISFDGYESWTGASATHTFDASNSRKLVVVVTGEHGFNQSANGQIYGVKYDGKSLIQAVDVNPKKITEGGHGDTACDIWYLDNPGAYHTAGLIEASTTNGNYVYTAILLSGTDDGVGLTAAAPGSASVDLTTSENSIVISVIGMGGGGNTANVDTVDPDSPAEAFEIDSLWVGSKWAGHVVARTFIETPSLQTFSFNTPKTDVATIAAVFEAVDPRLPDVDAGANMVSWSGATVALNPTVVNNDPNDPNGVLPYAWTASPSDGVVFTPNDGGDGSTSSALAPTVTITKAANTDDAAVITLKLTATLEGVGYMDDSMTVDVYDNACKAAIALDMADIDLGDFNRDCYTDLLDLVEIASQWLNDYAITEPTAK